MRTTTKTKIAKKGDRAVRTAKATLTARASGSRQAEWDLLLYIIDQTPASVAASASLKELCEAHLQGRYRIQVIDLLENPRIASEDGIVAIPTLVRKRPQPIKITIGNLSNSDRVRAALGIPLTARVQGDS